MRRQVVKGVRVQALQQLHYVLDPHCRAPISPKVHDIDNGEQTSEPGEEEDVLDGAWGADEATTKRFVLQFKQSDHLVVLPVFLII